MTSEQGIDWSFVEDDEISKEAMDLISKLLAHNPSERLGSNGLIFPFFSIIILKLNNFENRS